MFGSLAKHQIHDNIKKCFFGQTRLEYLGHWILPQGVSTDSSKVDVVQGWLAPQNVCQLRGFLSLVGYYRWFVVDYASIAWLLTRRGFAWTPEAQGAFEVLKVALSSAPVLVMLDFSQPFIVETDATRVGVGAVLQQHEWPIAYHSHPLSPVACSRSTYEHELLASSWQCTYDDIIWCSNCSSSTLTKSVSSTYWRSMRSTVSIIDYFPSLWATNLVSIQGKQVQPSSWCPLSLTWTASPVLGRHLDVWLRGCDSDLIGSGSRARAAKGYSRTDRRWNQHFQVHRDRRCPPPWWTGGLAIDLPAHSEAPSRIPWQCVGWAWRISAKTYRRINPQFFWRGMVQDTRCHVNQCARCQQFKTLALALVGLLQLLPIPQQVWEDLSMEFVEGLPKSGGINTIMVVVDLLGKYAHFIGLKHPFSAKDVAAKFTREVVLLHGIPLSIVSDQGNSFMSAFREALHTL